MFPSSGYFRVLPCPFQLEGNCSRPYCHFKHAKPKKNSSGPGASARDTANKKLPPFLQKNGLKSSPNTHTDTLPDIFESQESDKVTPAPESSAGHLNPPSSPPAPSYSPLPQSPSILDANDDEKDDQLFPELGEVCEETFTSTYDSKNSTATPPDESVEQPQQLELPTPQNEMDTDAKIEEEILMAVSNHTDMEMAGSLEENKTEEETTLLPDIIAKLQAPLAPVKRASDSTNSDPDLSPDVKRKRLSLIAEKRPSILVLSKKNSKLRSTPTVIDRDSIYMPKSAKSDPNVARNAPQSNSKPSLPLTMDSKVPVKMRQKFLDKVFEEYVKVLPENDSHSKVIYLRFLRCFTYLLLTSNLMIIDSESQMTRWYTPIHPP